MAGYHMLHANPARNGRVEVPVRVWTHSERLVLPEAQRSYGKSPHAVLVDPSGVRMAIVAGDHVLLVEPYGARVIDGQPGWLAAMLEEGLVYGPRLHPWDGPVVALDRGAAFHGRVMQIVTRHRPAWAAVLVAKRERGGGKLIARVGARQVALGTDGCAAMADDGSIIVADDEGRWVRLDADAQILAERALPGDVRPVELSIVGELVMAVDRDHRRLHALTPAGELRYSIDVGMHVRQPALDGAHARTYVAGEGLVALDGDRVAWRKPANVRVRVTSLGTAGCIVATGNTVRHLDREGLVRSEIMLPARTVAPVAPGPDGVLHVATDAGVFSLR